MAFFDIGYRERQCCYIAKDLRSFLGLVQNLRKFIPQIATKTAVLTALVLPNKTAEKAYELRKRHVAKGRPVERLDTLSWIWNRRERFVLAHTRAHTQWQTTTSPNTGGMFQSKGNQSGVFGNKSKMRLRLRFYAISTFYFPSAGGIKKQCMPRTRYSYSYMDRPG